MKRLTFLLIILLVLITSACTAGQASQGGGELVNTQWKLVSFGEAGVETAVIAGSTITLAFQTNDQVSGNGGCNTYGARYTTQADSLSIRDINSTLIACVDDQVTAQETHYLDALKTANRFEIAGDQLTLWYKNGQGKLNFVKESSG